MLKFPAFLVAGTKSGCGKTSMALGLMAAFTRRGLRVAPFKTGPDFIDPGFHSLICNRPSHNLDGWMMPEAAIKEVFCQGLKGCDLAIIEGAMGLFDGAPGIADKGSAAHIAKILGVPVVLVADGQGIGRSITAMVKGYIEYDEGLNVIGVIVNKAGSQKHKVILEQALCELEVPLKAIVQRDKKVVLPSRHLGLVTVVEHSGWDRQVHGLCDLVEHHVDLKLLMEILKKSGPDLSTLSPDQSKAWHGYNVSNRYATPKIAVARDKAFCFYYERNLEILRRFGAELVFFSPLDGDVFSEEISGVYLGGGYPELYAHRLAENKRLIHMLREGVERGLPVLAECGGFMFLGKGLVEGNKFFKWCDLYNSVFEMAKRFQALGYRQAVLQSTCLLGTKGTRFKGHEFRYSKPINNIDSLASERLTVRDATGAQIDLPHFIYKNVFASYIHIHFDSNPDVAAAFVKRCMEYAQGDNTN